MHGVLSEMVFQNESSALNFAVDTSAPVYDRVRERIVNWLVQWVSPDPSSLSIGVPSNQNTQSLASSSATSLTESVKGDLSSWWVSRGEQEEQTREDMAILLKTLYSSQENIILLHEMMRQVSLDGTVVRIIVDHMCSLSMALLCNVAL